jgi:hypothetical protein
VDSSGLAAGTVTAACTITVSPGSQTITFNPAAALVVGGSEILSASASSGLTVSFSSQTPSVCSVTGTTVKGLETGQCTVAANQKGNANYSPAPTVTQTITVNPAPLQLSVTPSSLSFGTVPRFSLLFKTVTLKNTGTSAVSIGKVSVTPGAGTDRYEFVPIRLCPSSLAVGKSCEIIVVLFAEGLGSLSATLNISDNAAGSPQTVSLSATATKGWD